MSSIYYCTTGNKRDLKNMKNKVEPREPFEIILYLTIYLLSSIWFIVERWFYLQRLESQYSANTSKFNYLFSFVQAEVETKTAKSSSSCTNALLWLTRYMIILCAYSANVISILLRVQPFSDKSAIEV